jgi:predicted acylesterase/phospholipase RssA
VLEPPPLLESPPFDRFCDLVLTGGVASGVVYPWAIVELARKFRFRNIGGTSVGAMAAAVTAAAEYGRRHGSNVGFEVLRQMPRRLAEEQKGGRTKMLSLFQPSVNGRRLFEVFLRCIQHFHSKSESSQDIDNTGSQQKRGHPSQTWLLIRFLLTVLRVYQDPALRFILIGALSAGFFVWHGARGLASWVLGLLALVLVPLVAATVGVVMAVLSDVRTGIGDNDLGLCRGGPEPGAGNDEESLVEWMHIAIQEAAGLSRDGKPLTFGDLWHAPLVPGGPPNQNVDPSNPGERSIDLEIVTTNVTHGRPYLLPLRDEMSRLFFREEELRLFFPDPVMQHLMRVSQPYRPEESEDPPAKAGWASLREMPGPEMPILVAARLSLSYPILFSAVPLYAIDYEPQERMKREPGLCRFSDGGLCSNFPIHLFDAAIPQWPTFGMWLDADGLHSRRPVWLPELPSDGFFDGWYHFRPINRSLKALPRLRGRSLGELGEFLRDGFMTAKDWKDRYGFRMPHVRNRVARLYLRPDEGELHIAMPGRLILEMAERYGTESAKKFIEGFVAEPTASEVPLRWREHLSVRFHLLLGTMRERLIGLTAAAAGGPHSMSIDELIEADPLFQDVDPKLSEDQKKSLHRLLDALRALEAAFEVAGSLPYRPVPTPELRMRTPV